MATILIVEDVVPIARLLGWFLIEDGHNVIVTTDIDSVREKIAEAGASIVVSNTGISPAEKSRYFGEWKAAHPGLSIVDVYVRTSGAGARGADAAISLPLHADDLVEAVRRLADPT